MLTFVLATSNVTSIVLPPMIQALGPRAEGCLAWSELPDRQSRCAMPLPSPYATLINAMRAAHLMDALSGASLARSHALLAPAALSVADPLSCDAVVVCLSKEAW